MVARDAPVEREKRPRDDNNPWPASWCPDHRRRLEILGDSKVVCSWIKGTWEVKSKEHGDGHCGSICTMVLEWYISAET